MSDRPVVVKPDNQPNIVVTGFVGTSTNGIIELLLYSDTLNADEAFKVTPPDPDRIVLTRTTSSKISLDPIIATQLAAWLRGQVDIYQSNFGVLKVPPGPPRSPTKLMTQLKREEEIEQGDEQKRADEKVSKAAGKGQQIKNEA